MPASNVFFNCTLSQTCKDQRTIPAFARCQNELTLMCMHKSFVTPGQPIKMAEDSEHKEHWEQMSPAVMELCESLQSLQGCIGALWQVSLL